MNGIRLQHNASLNDPTYESVVYVFSFLQNEIETGVVK